MKFTGKLFKALLYISFSFCFFITNVLAISNQALNTKTPGLPSEKKVMFFIGQDATSLREFKNSVLDKDPEFPSPAGISIYTNLVYGAFLAGMGAKATDDNGVLMPGFNHQTNNRYDFGGGPQSFPQAMAQFPNAALNVGLYMSDAFVNCSNQPLRAIHAIENPPMGSDITPDLSAAYANAIDVMVKTMKIWDRQVYLRIGYEFDGQWNCYGSDLHKNAFKYIAKRIRLLGATNVATVWHTSAWPRDEQPHNPQYNFIATSEDHLEKWYPGDEYVDWIGMSTFFGKHYKDYQWTCDDKNPEFYSPSVDPRKLQNRLLDFARKEGKPVMLAEASPQGIQTDNLTASCIFYRSEKPLSSSKRKEVSAFRLWYSWYRDWFDFIRNNKDIIRAVAYINSDWDNISQFQCNNETPAGTSGCLTGYWGDSRIQNNDFILRQYKRQLKAPYWFKVKESL